MLPYTPLHHLLLENLGFPVVATSGNLANEPLCFDEQEACQNLTSIADYFLIHNRPIARPLDDSILQIVNDRPVVLRCARGYAPLTLSLLGSSKSFNFHPQILALGAHLKNAIALFHEDRILMGQHLGDLDNLAAIARFHEAVTDLLTLHTCHPTAIAHDAHPDYYSTQFAQTFHSLKPSIPSPKLFPIQHHYAHILACIIDNQLQLPVLGIAWDGTGYGLDRTIWGGEFLYIPAKATDCVGFERLGHLRPFPLPGADRAVKEPRRSALGLLYECLGEALFEREDLALMKAFSSSELNALKTMLVNNSNAPKTSSIGRLFDAVSAMLNLCHQVSFEGQAAMQLEFAVGDNTNAFYPYELRGVPLILDWQPLLMAILDDLQAQVSPTAIATKFHNTLITAMVEFVKQFEIKSVALSGGCFQNRYLIEGTIGALNKIGINPAFHQRIPTNDGGIAVGQLLGALRCLEFELGE